MIKFQCGLTKNPSTIRNVLEKITQAAVARDVARKARDNIRRKGSFEITDFQVNLLIVRFPKKRERNFISLRVTPQEVQQNKEEIENSRQYCL